MSKKSYEVLSSDSRSTTGHFFIDEDLLRAKGVTDFSAYALNPSMPLFPDVFVDG
jgi:citronellol/citronellal dehydrogenase